MKKADKSSFTGTTAEQRTEAQNQQVSQPIAKPNVVCQGGKFCYCQSQIEGGKYCKKQCDHCKEYFAPLERDSIAARQISWRVYVIEVDKGAWDDWSWWIHGIYDCPIKADEAKRKLLAKIEADKMDKSWIVSHHAKSINEVQVKEYKLNEIVSR